MIKLIIVIENLSLIRLIIVKEIYHCDENLLVTEFITDKIYQRDENLSLMKFIIVMKI